MSSRVVIRCKCESPRRPGGGITIDHWPDLTDVSVHVVDEATGAESLLNGVTSVWFSATPQEVRCYLSIAKMDVEIECDATAATEKGART